jgi:hypothetical protein
LPLAAATFFPIAAISVFTASFAACRSLS